jgi:tRNA pseudouridine38-40 synthase
VRLRLDLAYDGTDFHGWAVQPGLRTVQGLVEEALARVLRVDTAQVTCAGRTDTGVHARGQVLHVDVDGERFRASTGRTTAATPADVLLRRLNGVLPPDVRVHRVAESVEGFDARFSALWRRYAYRIADAPRLVDPLLRRTVLVRQQQLDLAAMNLGAQGLVGEHDFAAFCRRREGATTVRTLLELSWHRDGSGLAVATVRADAFCHHMVRALVGCLVVVGERRRPPGWAADVLRRGVRDPGVTVVRPHGLTLEQVAYPADADLAERARSTRVRRSLPEICCG